jgi:hypothetical protein
MAPQPCGSVWLSRAGAVIASSLAAGARDGNGTIIAVLPVVAQKFRALLWADPRQGCEWLFGGKAGKVTACFTRRS